MSDSPPSLPPAHLLPTLPLATQRTTLSLLFEPSPTIHSLLTPITTTPTSYPDLVAQIRTQLLALASSAQNDAAALASLEYILGSHPRLGEKNVKGQSKGEQGSLQAGGAQSEEQRELGRLNAEYERRFPGLRYVVFVNARPLGEILTNMRERIERGDVLKEREEAIEAMCAIAVDRAGKLPVRSE